MCILKNFVHLAFITEKHRPNRASNPGSLDERTSALPLSYKDQYNSVIYI